VTERRKPNVTNAVTEGAVLSVAFLIGVFGMPVAWLGLLLALYGVYYLYSRRAALGQKPIAARIGLLGLAGLIVAGAFGAGVFVRFLAQGP
jgi:hypothetical protein